MMRNASNRASRSLLRHRTRNNQSHARSDGEAFSTWTLFDPSSPFHPRAPLIPDVNEALGCDLHLGSLRI